MSGTPRAAGVPVAHWGEHGAKRSGVTLALPCLILPYSGICWRVKCPRIIYTDLDDLRLLATSHENSAVFSYAGVQSPSA